MGTVDEQREDEPPGRAEAVDEIAYGGRLVELDLGAITGRVLRKVIPHRPEAGDAYLHAYLSTGTPTRLPYSVQEPS